MSATLLANELSNLVSESKRKNTELRNASEKSLSELKSFPATSEHQLSADLSRRPHFIEPFVIACNTRNPKFAGSGVVSLQRLVISKGLPKSRLKDALEAFIACTDLGLDIQLKILQALPSLLQNYAAELEGELLSGALQVCSSLQAVKASTVSGVAAATLQQLVTTIFEKVVHEDRKSDSIAASEEVPGKDGPLHVRPAAFDAYRVLRDLALAAEERSTKFVSFTSLSPESSLELIWSCVDSNPELFQAHEELMSIIASNIIPLVIRALSEKLSFAVTVRSLRLLNLVLDRYLAVFQEECEIALNLCTQAIESDATAVWKRALVMEVLRDFFIESGQVIDAYAAFDGRESGKPIVQDLMSAFVRLSTEKPAAIGLAQQSTMPVGPPSQKDGAIDHSTLDATGGMAGVLGNALGVIEAAVYGISSQWSLPKVACMDQLDKTDPPALPETYVYALVLECFNGLSDGLARVVLPLSVQHENGKIKATNGNTVRRGRSGSFRTRAVPLNPLQAQSSPHAARIQAVAGLVDTCWPAVLATSSTYLNAALDDQYFRNLIKAYQRFAQVAGVLRLVTPRDALMTTLAKAAIPPHVLNAAIHEPAKSPRIESPRVFSNPKNLLSVDSLVSQASSLSTEKDRRSSLDAAKPMLTVRNLLCLRALLNLAIALGPTLDKAFVVIVSALKQADIVLSSSTPHQLTRQSSFSSAKSLEPQASAVQAFSAEIAAVEAAASRLLESTADYPSDAFRTVLDTFCQLLHKTDNEITSPGTPRVDLKSPPLTPFMRSPRRTFSGLPGISSFAELQTRDYQFVIPKLGHLAELNVSRFIDDEPAASGFDALVTQLTDIATTNDAPRDARRSATNVLAKLVETMIADTVKEDSEVRAVIQRRTFAVLLKVVDGIHDEERDLTANDLDIQSQVVDALRVILERCGDSLIAGWNRIIAIISGAFEYDGSPIRGAEDEDVNIKWRKVTFDLVSSSIGRNAFSATQLVCSDFLESLPRPVIPSLVELLHRFICQSDDMNISLTTVTMAWNLSDVLFQRCVEHELAEFIDVAREADDLDAMLKETLRESNASQWFFLLMRLRDVATSHDLKEIRNAAFQTVCNVFKNRGSELSPATWDLLLRSTLLHVSKADASLYMQDEAQKAEADLPSPDLDMSKTIITGVSAIFASQLRLIEQIAKLPSLWEVFLNSLERYLDVESHPLNREAYAALAKVLAAVETESGVWRGPAFRTLSLWLKRCPQSKDGKQTNQDAYAAYVDAGEQVHRLTRDMSMSQRRTVIDNLWHCTRTANGTTYGGNSTLSPLQHRVMQLLRSMQQDQKDDVSGLVTIAAKLATLHHDSSQGSHSSGFVAVSSEALQWLQGLLQLQVSHGEVTDSMYQAVSALRNIVITKYSNTAESRNVALWRRATTTAVEIAKPVLELTERRNSDRGARKEIWAAFIDIVGGVVKAQDLQRVENRVKVHEDMLIDIEAFKSLREVLVPRLGSDDLPDNLRNAYARALFEASIIHETEKSEVPGADHSALQDLYDIRRGRVRKVPYTWREDMSYICWKELIALSTNKDEGPLPMKLAEAAAPFLVLRWAVPIRAYIADQPLRGRRPQPRAELEELLFAFETIKNSKLRAEALKAVSKEGQVGGDQAHVRLLYPLLIRAIETAGDRMSGTEEVLKPLQAALGMVSDIDVVLR